MEIAERFLPLGSVVLLKGGKREIMIMSYCIIPSGEGYDKNGKVDLRGKVFDYGGCLYPEGMGTSDQLYGFNHDQIEKVCHVGYKTEISDELSKMLNETMEKYNKII